MTREEAAAKAQSASQEICDVFSRLFGSDDGKKALAHLVSMAPPAASRFHDGKAFNPDPVLAAWKDGRAVLVAEIHGLIKRGAYNSQEIS